MALLFRLKPSLFQRAFSMAASSTAKNAAVLSDMRVQYASGSLDLDILDKDPISQFRTWFAEAAKRDDLYEPNAMCLSTATSDGVPSGRMVLLKGVSEEGFSFFTNYGELDSHDALPDCTCREQKGPRAR